MDLVTTDLLHAQDGDGKAFSRFMAATQEDVRRYCQWQCRGSQDLDDLVQETFFKAFKGLQSYSGIASPRTWLLSIARNVCIDSFRSKQREMDRQTALTVISRGSRDASSHAVEVQQLVNDLPEIFREAFVLVRVFGFRYDEVAVILDCPRGTVQSRVARARQILTENLRLDSSQKIS